MVVKDEKRAAELYQLAANQGNADAQCELGKCYEFGKGVVEDQKKPNEYFMLAAESSMEALYLLGLKCDNKKIAFAP